MPLLILAVVFAVVQTPPPVPRKAPDKQAHEATQNKQSTNANQPQSPTSAPPATLPSPAKHEESPTEPTEDNAAKTVIVSEPAPMARKDAWDKAYVIATLLLVGIGGWGVYYARKSLRAIESQLEKMGQQVTEMQSAGKQTDQLLETMRETAIRDQRAYVCMDSARIVFKKERAPEVHVYLKNFGKTPAYDVRMWIGGATGPYPAPEPLKPAPDELPMGVSVLPPGAKPYTMIWRSDEIPQQVMPILGTKAFTIYVYGKITYRDAFKKQRSTKYRLIFGGREPHGTVVNEAGYRMGNMKTDSEGNEAD